MCPMFGELLLCVVNYCYGLGILYGWEYCHGLVWSSYISYCLWIYLKLILDVIMGFLFMILRLLSWNVKDVSMKRYDLNLSSFIFSHTLYALCLMSIVLTILLVEVALYLMCAYIYSCTKFLACTHLGGVSLFCQTYRYSCSILCKIPVLSSNTKKGEIERTFHDLWVLCVC
jgi:hypothetical protein